MLLLRRLVLILPLLAAGFAQSQVAAPSSVGDTAMEPFDAKRTASDTVVADQRVAIGVFPLHADTASVVLAELLADGLTNGIVQTGTFRVVSIPDTLHCADSACVDSVARHLGLDQYLTGTVHLYDTTAVLQTHLHRLHDSATSHSNRSWAGQIHEAVQQLPAQALNDLFGWNARVHSAATEILPTLVVLDFVPEGGADQSAAEFSDSVAGQLNALGSFKVLSKATRDSLLDGWAPGSCTTADCRMQIGVRLGVSYLLTGNVSKLGENWSSKAQLLQTETGALVREASVSQSGQRRLLFDRGASSVARQITGQEVAKEDIFLEPLHPAKPESTLSKALWLGIPALLASVAVLISW